MQVKFRQKFEHDIKEICSQKVLNAVAKAITSVEKCSKLAELSNIKKIKAKKGYFRIRIGNYRIGIFLDKDCVEFVRVLPRDKIYKYFPD
ncbi:MAG: type II toxin-antitoxin system RelE/ParE family toxin [Bacteroidales bacterium]|nr:type II toxin-antitoxin system RelE/ParE family toxin [Bacteroidales bacterium]MDD3860707.1 type II toxin-antitoxin system RelE/ParE family toxin [Bacteroidales bacterium]